MHVLPMVVKLELCRVLVFLGGLLFAHSGFAKNIVANSCAFADVQTALWQARDGDTLAIPAGVCQWADNSLEIDKEIEIVGRGANTGGTHIIRSVATSAPLMRFDCLARPLAFKLSGVRFQGLFNPSLSNALNDRGVQTIHGCQDFLISNNVFTGFATGGVDITDNSNNNARNRGVIAENRFIENFKVGLGYGVTVSSGGRNNLDISYGSQNFVFIEDNYFAKNRHAVTSNFDAAYVLRHNLIEDNYPNFTPVDTHGRTSVDPDDRGGTKIVEIYNNVIQNNDDATYMHQRIMGSGLAFCLSQQDTHR